MYRPRGSISYHGKWILVLFEGSTFLTCIGNFEVDFPQAQLNDISRFNSPSQWRKMTRINGKKLSSLPSADKRRVAKSMRVKPVLNKHGKSKAPHSVSLCDKWILVHFEESTFLAAALGSISFYHGISILFFIGFCSLKHTIALSGNPVSDSSLPSWATRAPPNATHYEQLFFPAVFPKWIRRLSHISFMFIGGGGWLLFTWKQIIGYEDTTKVQ
ncbi:hypothetical protein BDP27DRAFT_1357335 [Rhodocollybia butyracea]|uniref:Uncharacterized protein n=1 Tax=Rhodocollybia butyracea TaxID=206335 RepID=A0A9P5Q9L0_9AGAR|nr:hypothetical protein BDP27DRAFT_1357335 [Rhodocollybia butyracea]